ncbi:hypothetical protein [Paenibacillus oleatilyticus]|uniref:Uncharacterized protein n=1 Tax=Paenibacillus oleatilyticus TaxID=2594886 RepID=A0ABV4UT26_9BACL
MRGRGKLPLRAIPRPNPEIERTATGHGPVVSYKLSPEELERMTYNGLTKQALLEAVAAGETLSSIEKAYGLKYNAIYNLVKKWELKGITPERARELLVGTQASASDDPEKEPAAEPADVQALKADNQRMAERIADLEWHLEIAACNLARYESEKRVKSASSIFDKLDPVIELLSDLAQLKTPALQSVIEERQRQNAKWGEQNHPLAAWVSILGEEYGELCEAVNETIFNNGPEAREKGGHANIRAEAVQVAAVAVQIVEMLDRAKEPQF